uniref:Matrix-remodeling-associated protein 7 isoform X1 n=1 Tax=Pogona vitticeps TaxID=103695 RepID=A0ABM5FMD9_9SAUR
MLPGRGRNLDNLIPCKMTKRKNLEPPDPKKAPCNSSLLKALEAVVAAGRSGLLGPAAAAAAADIPEVGLGAANGADPQGAPNPIPCLSATEEEEEEKPATTTVSVEPSSVITIVPSSQDTGSLQPVLNDVWICGNSVILTSKKRAESKLHGLQLDIPPLRAHVYWHGVQAMRWEDILPLLHEIYHLRSPPSIIIIHVGEDDLLPGNHTSFLMAMKNDLGILRRALPSVIIIWSSLLPKPVWGKDQKPEEMEKIRKHVNIKMVSHCNKIGVHCLPHNLITSEKTGLFLPDLNDLSDAGADIFISDLKKILRYFSFLWVDEKKLKKYV